MKQTSVKIGDRYNKLVVIAEVDKSSDGRRRFMCQCDCGRNKVLVCSQILRTKSCGCLKNAGRPKDLTGKRFGRLTVICEADDDNQKLNHVTWMCMCDCGNTTFVRAGSLNCKESRRTKSCGCLIVEASNSRRQDIIGKRFGRLLITGLNEDNEKSSKVKFDCECDCGRSFIVSRDQINRRLKSCGCLNKEIDRGKAGRNHGPILPLNQSLWNIVFRRIRRGAISRGKLLELSNEKIKCMVLKPCEYCGAKHSRIISNNHGSILVNGIDRLDPAFGYVDGNCVPCCTTCNRAKQKMLPLEFLAWARRVVDYTNKSLTRVTLSGILPETLLDNQHGCDTRRNQ